VFIGGNISISGTTTSFSDNILLINKNPSVSTDTGIIFQRYTSDIQNNDNYAGIIYSEQNDAFNLGYLVSDADRNYVSMGNLVSLNTKDITTGNINFTGNLYNNGTLYNPGSKWTTTNSDISYTSGNVNTSNLITTNISGSNLRLSGDLYVGGTLSVVNVTTTNVVDINISTGTITVSGLSNFANVIATNISTGTINATTYTGESMQLSGGVTVGTLRLTSTNIALGASAGNTSQSVWGIAIGRNAGNTSQGSSAVAIGAQAGQTLQGVQAVAIGNNTGTTSQGNSSTAIGPNCATNAQGASSVAVGTNSGNRQGTYATAIGPLAGSVSQGNYAVAIGTEAGRTSQHANSIVINANSSQLNSATAGAFYVSSIRNVTQANLLAYDTTLKEISYFSLSNFTTTNLVATNISTGTFIASTGITTAALLNTGLISSANLFSTTATLPNIVVTNVSTGTLTASGTSSLANVTASYIRLDSGTALDVIGNADAANLTQTYIAFGLAGTTNDASYLRQIGGVNSYKMALDIHDDGDEPGFCIRGVNSTDIPDAINERFTVQASGNVGINNASPSANLDVVGTVKVSGTSSLTNVTATNVSTGVVIASTGITTGILLATTSISSGIINATNSTITNVVATTLTSGGLIVNGTTRIVNTNDTVSTGTLIVAGSGVRSLTVGESTVTNPQSIIVQNTFGATEICVAGTLSDFSVKSIPGDSVIRSAKNLLLQSGPGNVNLYVATSGNVGINTSSPAYTLDVNGNMRVGDLYPTNIYSTNVHSTYVYTNALSVNHNNNISSQGVHIQWNRSGGDGETWIINQRGLGTINSGIRFGESDISNNTTEWMRIIQNGNVGVGTTAPAYQLHLSSDSAAKPSTNTWTISSDIRLKTNITMANLDICYNNVKNIPLKRYTWRDEIYTAEQVPDRSKLGWIAQDVETFIPKAVEQKEMHGYSDCRSLNSDQIIASLYGSVQKLIQDFENEREQHNATKQAFDNLKTELQNKFPGEFN
jgi:hypothetical protein